MSDIAIKNAEAYAARYGLRIAAQLGFGVHGSVHAVEDKINKDRSAIKAHIEAAPFARERVTYERLQAAKITKIMEFHVPQFIRADDDLWVIEMTIVTRPFVLDFAGAYLDKRPEFSEDIWAEWQAQKREQFGNRWKIVERVMNAFEELGIFLMDVTPNNIAFAD